MKSMTPTMTAPPKNKIRVKAITIHQAEGLPQDCTTTTHETWSEAEKRIRSICERAKDMGCLKTDFTLVYADGESYTGRYDAALPSKASYEGTLSDHVRSHLTFSAGLHRPDHVTEENYERYLAECETRIPGFKQNALTFLKGYALTDEEAGPSPAPPNPEPRNDTVNTAATATPVHQKTASEAHADNVAFAKANNLPMVAVIGNTFPIRGVLYAFGGKWDGKTKQWSVPSHKHAEAQAAADKFAKPTKAIATAAPVPASPSPSQPQPASPSPTPLRPSTAPINAPQKPAKGKTSTAAKSPLQKRLAALLAGAEHVRIDAKDTAASGELFFAIEHIKKAIEGLS
jgi:hypothetical protein